MFPLLGVSGVTENFLIYRLEFIYLSRWEAVTNDCIGNTDTASSHSDTLSPSPSLSQFLIILLD